MSSLKTSIFINMRDGKSYVSRTSVVSADLGLQVGDLVPDSYQGDIMIEEMVCSPEQARAFRERLGLSVEAFAEKFGRTVEQVNQQESPEQAV